METEKSKQVIQPRLHVDVRNNERSIQIPLNRLGNLNFSLLKTFFPHATGLSYINENKVEVAVLLEGDEFTIGYIVSRNYCVHENPSVFSLEQRTKDLIKKIRGNKINKNVEQSAEAPTQSKQLKTKKRKTSNVPIKKVISTAWCHECIPTVDNSMGKKNLELDFSCHNYDRNTIVTMVKSLYCNDETAELFEKPAIIENYTPQFSHYIPDFSDFWIYLENQQIQPSRMKLRLITCSNISKSDRKGFKELSSSSCSSAAANSTITSNA